MLHRANKMRLEKRNPDFDISSWRSNIEKNRNSRNKYYVTI